MSLPSGGAGRQALVGSAWHAPLPLLLQSPFAKAPALYLFILAAVVGLAVFRHLRRVAAQMTEIIDNRCGGNGGAAKPQKYLLSVIYYLLSIICALAVGAAVVSTAAPTANALFVLAVLKLLDWTRKRRLRDWVWFSFLMAGLLLCGLPYIGWVVAMLIIAPLLIAADRRTRPRTGGLMFLCLAPVIYAAGCWILLSYLILDDPFFAWRFIGDLSFDTFPRAAVWTAAACAAGGALAAAVHKIGGRIRSPICAAASVAPAAILWFATLSAAALDWSLPWGAPANIAPPDRDAVAQHVKAVTPWGRVFVCGYAGLGGQCSDSVNDAMFEPCLDLHIGVLRKAYTRQKLYLLVPKPERENALEPCEWRYGGIYDNGAQRLLFDQDFGPWRLYEVVSAEF